MFDPVSNQLSNHAARRAADARRPLEKRASASDKPERGDAADSFDHPLGGVERANAGRPVSDAVGEEGRLERAAHRTMGEAETGEGPPTGSTASSGREKPGGGPTGDGRAERRLDVTA